MRVTDQTKQQAVVLNMNRNSEKLQSLMTNISSGKRINKPSDDPVGIVMSQDYRTTINHVDTISKNIVADRTWLDAVEASIQQMEKFVTRVKELAIQAADGTASAEGRIIIAGEVDVLLDDLVKIGNSKEGKIFLFSGTKTLTEPLTRSGKESDSRIEFSGTRIKSQNKTIPLLQSLPLLGLDEGEIMMNLYDRDRQKTEIVVKLDGSESLDEVVKKINLSVSAESGFVEDPESPTGFKHKMLAQIGVDESLYLDPSYGYRLQLDEDTTGLFESMDFGIVGDDFGLNPSLPRLSFQKGDLDQYEASFSGYSNKNYIARVIRGGEFGAARFIVSDDNGESWSQAQILNQSIDVYNPEGDANGRIELNFKSGTLPYFVEGLEFHFDGNPVVAYQGNEDIKEVLVDSGIKIPVNVTAKQIFFQDPEDRESVNVFDTINQLRQAMLNDDQTAIVKSIEDITLSYNQILKQRGQIGVIMNEFQSSEDRISQTKLSKTEQLSELEDLDLPKAIIELNSAETLNSASLSAGARLIQPSLLQFLK